MGHVFEKVQPGDPVLHTTANRHQSKQLVERVTATQLVVDGIKYSRRNGREVGSRSKTTRGVGYDGSIVKPWNEDKDAPRVRRQNARARLETASFKIGVALRRRRHCHHSIDSEELEQAADALEGVRQLLDRDVESASEER